MGSDVRIERMGGQLVDTIDVSEDDDASVGVCLLGRPLLGLLVPAVNGTAPEINVEFTPDGGTTWYPILEDDGSTEAVALTGTATAHGVGSDDLSPLAGYCAHDLKVRLVIATAQTADREFVWLTAG